MENAIDALKIAFAIMMFVMALSLSISSLSQANAAVTAIISLNDRETDYNYVEPTGNSRIVGVETIVPTMYQAYRERIQIYFYEADGDPLNIYTTTDKAGNEIHTNFIDGSEVFQNAEQPIEHLNQILKNDDNGGLYKYLAGKKFEEKLGEYYQNDSDDTPDVNKTKARVITYILQ